MKKRKKFYSNKQRNIQWTEEPKGHEIDFADKYIDGASYGDKFDSKRPSYQAQLIKERKERRKKKVNKVISVLLCIAIICVGYTSMDIYMIRHAKPLKSFMATNSEEQINLADVALNVSACKVESVSLDGSVMLSSISNELEENGFTGLVFDAKRNDGTIGYASKLASIDTYGAISNPASQPEASIKKLLHSDILPIARICCYQDNIVPNQDSTAGIMNGKKPYVDSNGNSYLNPNSDSAYSYIKDIVAECYNYGITVFILYGFDLPAEISDNYNDGFEAISKRLTNDFGSSIKILEEVDASIIGKSEEDGRITNTAIKNEIDGFKKIKSNQILYVSTKADAKKVNGLLNKKDFNCFVIEE